MKSFFILILLISTSFAKPALVPVGDGLMIGVSDLKDLKIYLLIFAVTSLLSLIKFIWGFFSGERRELTERVRSLEKSQDEVLSELKLLTRMVGSIKDSQVSESGIINIVRKEAEFIEKVKQRRS